MPGLSKKQVHARAAASHRWAERSEDDFEMEVDSVGEEYPSSQSKRLHVESPEEQSSKDDLLMERMDGMFEENSDVF